MTQGAARHHLPALEPETASFWTAGRDGQLKIARCVTCQHYQHPPLPRCPVCAGDMQPTPVSGRGRIASFTVNQQAWAPGLETPFVFAAVELIEQNELYVFTNIVGCPVNTVRIGAPVRVTFEQHGDIFLPLFQPAEAAHAG